jgi:hypothetical protein
MNLSNSVTATVINSAVNYFSSALVGQLLFGETLSLKWWCGSSLILLGLFVIIRKDNPKEKEQKEIRNETQQKQSNTSNDSKKANLKSKDHQETSTNNTRKRSKKD